MEGESMSDVNKSGGSFSCIPLKWDTDYFGISCARVNLTGPATEAEQEEILSFCRSFDFVTLANLNNFSENNFWIGRRTNAFLADVNIQFFKSVDEDAMALFGKGCFTVGGNKSRQQEQESLYGNKRGQEAASGTNCRQEIEADISCRQEEAADGRTPLRQEWRLKLDLGEIVICNSLEADFRLPDMAGRVFKYSRFFADPFLPADLAAGIYRQWCRDAFMRQDKYFAICYREHEPAAFLLFIPDSADGCRIELVAVGEKFQGQGIGKALLAACEAFCAGQEIGCIRVGTQAGNAAAIGLYLGSGFKYSHCSSIYHMWKRILY